MIQSDAIGEPIGQLVLREFKLESESKEEIAKIVSKQKGVEPGYHRDAQLRRLKIIANSSYRWRIVYIDTTQLRSTKPNLRG